MIFFHHMFPIAILFILFFLNVPIALSLIGASLYYFAFINTGIPMTMVVQQFTTAVESFPYLAVPFFIMLGSVMNYSGISDKLMDMAEVLAGHLKGGLAQVNCLLSALMGGITGSANADAAMESKILIPAMLKKGLPLGFSAAVTAASSSVSPVIPPGNNLIIYAMIANVTVGDMFLAGYTPGLFMTAALMVTVYIISVKNKYAPTREKMAGLGEIGRQTLKSIFALIIPFVIILGMRMGVTTPTEAGGVAVLFALIVVIAYKKLRWKHIPIILKETVQSTASVMLIIAAAKVFGYYMSSERIPQMITAGLLYITNDKFVLLMIINVLLLIIGMFIEGGAALVILGPLLVPVAVARGVDPLHFGVILIVNIMIGGLTPPFGSMMFTVCSIVNCKLQDFLKQIWPFIVALLLVLIIVTYSEYVPIHTAL